ncbi:class I SAM-dependent methyltransferase [Dactylosporangium vinaceum]|uniref:Class I SAM-dependent methyltransferase n=1 Tax=Dactylosporangium vinaceum TaxID=53362 RepID=A0ABV5MDX7_9ACTN|nr:class I SAM-dependent methyltransferase [Dactylosporangium vinaceum]
MGDIWDAAAATFDDEPDHGLRGPAVRAAWTALLASVLPQSPAAIVDVGCGTGSLALVAAGLGHRVVGLDRSAAMLQRARQKRVEQGVALPLVRGDAERPPFAPGSFDVVLVRHVLWSVEHPAATVARWIELLRGPHGMLVLIEGRWSTGAGLSAAQCAALVPRARVRRLDDPGLWGGPVGDERYLVTSRTARP